MHHQGYLNKSNPFYREKNIHEDVSEWDKLFHRKLASYCVCLCVCLWTATSLWSLSEL